MVGSQEKSARRYVDMETDLEAEDAELVKRILSRLERQYGTTDKRLILRKLEGRDCRKVSKNALSHTEEIVVPLAPREVLAKFSFTDRKGLEVARGVRDLLGGRISTDATEVTLIKHPCLRRADSGDILDTIVRKSQRDMADREKFKAFIATCLLAQWNGEDGTFQNTGDANTICYLAGPEVQTVKVCWLPSGSPNVTKRGWRIQTENRECGTRLNRSVVFF